MWSAESMPLRASWIQIALYLGRSSLHLRKIMMIIKSKSVSLKNCTKYIEYSWTFLKRFYVFIFREREKERERNISVWLPLVHPILGTWPATQACALTGNRTGNPLLHSPVLNPPSCTSQASKFFLMQDYISENVSYKLCCSANVCNISNYY